MLYGQVLLMKHQLKNEGVLAETYYQEAIVYPMGESNDFWALILSGGPNIGRRICREKQFFQLLNEVKAHPEWYVGERDMTGADDGSNL